MSSVIRLSNVSKKYSSSAPFVLDNINLIISQGESIGIVGENGSGKTTLLKLLAGNILPTNGTVELSGEIEALFDSAILLDQNQTPYEICKDYLYLKGLDRKSIEQQLPSIISFCNLGERFFQPFYTLSLGMKARVQFAIKTSCLGEIVLIDEVLGAGDSTMAAKSAKRIADISSSTTFVCVSHSLSQIRSFTHRCIWIKDSKIHMDDSTENVLSAYEGYMKEKISLFLKTSQQEKELSIVQHADVRSDIIQYKEACPYPREVLERICMAENVTIDAIDSIKYSHKSYALSELTAELYKMQQQGCNLLSISLYHKKKPFSLNVSLINPCESLSRIVLGDGEWLMLIRYLDKQASNILSMYEIKIANTNNSDPPLWLLNTKIYLNNDIIVEPYLSTQC